jgi:hypothetical protein
MTFTHPSWCAGTEPANGDHASGTLHAARPDDRTTAALRVTSTEGTALDIHTTLHSKNRKSGRVNLTTARSRKRGGQRTACHRVR